MLGKEIALSIDVIVEELTTHHILYLQDGNIEDLDAARKLIFTIVGWQSMLYQADSGSTPPQYIQLADEMDGFQGESRLLLRQPSDACRHCLSDLLLGFGLLLPPENFVFVTGGDALKACSAKKNLEAQQLSAAPLIALAQVEIRWVDSLSCHLELDQHNSILYLFRFPSFCAVNSSMNLECHQQHGYCRPIYACACQLDNNKQWAKPDDVAQLLKEILLTYRLIFGQSKQGRCLFRKLKPFKGLDRACQDPFLAELCGQEFCCDAVQRLQREVYSLPQDFPMLRGRLVALEYYLSQRRPKTWKQLWQDRRDGGQWFTFWAILIVGGIGLLLAFIQTVLQILQLGLHSGS